MLKKIRAWIANIAIAIAIAAAGFIAFVLGRRRGDFDRVYDAIGDHDERTRERDEYADRVSDAEREAERVDSDVSELNERADDVIDRARRTIESNREFLERYRAEREGRP